MIIMLSFPAIIKMDFEIVSAAYEAALEDGSLAAE
jgi:hypothetical protein